MRLIDADKLQERAYQMRFDTRITDGGLALINYLLSDAPTVDPVKHGRWKPFDLTWGRSIYYCTSCGEAGEVPTEIEKPIYDYCPNCGAKMDEV